MIDPDPADAICEVHFACLLRNGTEIRVVHDRHVHGLSLSGNGTSRSSARGFKMTSPSLDPATHEGQVAFLARRPE